MSQQSGSGTSLYSSNKCLKNGCFVPHSCRSLGAIQRSDMRTDRTYAIAANASAESPNRRLQLRQREFGDAADFSRSVVQPRQIRRNSNRPFAADGIIIREARLSKPMRSRRMHMQRIESGASMCKKGKFSAAAMFANPAN